MITLTVEALENIAKLARKRIDAGLRHHGEQWRLGGRTGINFMMEKMRRLATPKPPKDAGAVPLPETVLTQYGEPGNIPRPLCTVADAIRYADALAAEVIPPGYELVRTNEIDTLRNRKDRMAKGRVSGGVPDTELIEQLQDACVTSDGTPLTDNAEPWGCDVGLLRKSIAALSALPQHPPATRVQVVTLFGHPKRNLYHRPQGLSETVGGFDLRSREIGAAIEPFGVVNQKLTTEEDATVKESLTVAESTGGEAVAVVDFIEGSAGTSTQATLRRPLPAGTELYTHRLPMADHVVKALAAKFGVYYFNGKVDLGAPLYAFTPTEIIEFASRLAGADHA